jgi:uncharacterized protein (UPF0332 family)
MVEERINGWRIDKAQRFLAAADRAFEAEDWDTAVSRAYYACYHVVIALLELRAGVRRRRWDHVEVQTEFRQRFANRGFLFTRRDAQDLESNLSSKARSGLRRQPLSPSIRGRAANDGSTVDRQYYRGD